MDKLYCYECSEELKAPILNKISKNSNVMVTAECSKCGTFNHIITAGRKRKMSFSMENCPQCGSENTEYDWQNNINVCKSCEYEWEG